MVHYVNVLELRVRLFIRIGNDCAIYTAFNSPVLLSQIKKEKRKKKEEKEDQKLRAVKIKSTNRKTNKGANNRSKRRHTNATAKT